MTTKIILAGSLLLNAGLTAYVATHRPPTPSAAQQTQPAKPPVFKPGAKTAATAGAALEAPGEGSTAPGKAFDWRQVESEDYKKYIANLRAIGCPEATIRDIIVADVNKLYEDRKKAKTQAGQSWQYWKTGLSSMMGAMVNEEKLKESQALAKEKRALLVSLLGVAPVEKPDLMGGMNPYETLLDFLPAAKQNQLMELEQKYAAQTMKSFKGGTPDAEDMKAILKVQKDKEAEMAAILSPEEMENYQLRMSQTAMMMRMQLNGFDMNEEEFRSLYKIRKQFDDEFNPLLMGASDKTEREKRDAAQKAMLQQVKQSMSPDRFAEYERVQDFAYQNVYKVTEREGLPKTTAVEVYEMKKALDAETRTLQTNTTLSREERAQALKAIQDATQKAISAKLGPKAWESYRKQLGSPWNE